MRRIPIKKLLEDPEIKRAFVINSSRFIIAHVGREMSYQQVAEIFNARHGCEVNPLSSACCRYGTKGCVSEHRP